MHNRFSLVQEEYYKLRGQYAVGRLTESEFEAALHDLITQDAQGNYWTIEATTGEWYFYDGTQWIQRDPSRTELPYTPVPEPTPLPVANVIPQPTITHEVPVIPKPAFTPNARPTNEPLQEQVSGRGLMVPFLVTGFILLIVAGIAFLLFKANPIVLADASGLPTRIVPATAVAFQPTASLVPPTPTLLRQTLTPVTTPLPITVTPPALIIEPTDALPALSSIPTVTPIRGGPNPADQGSGSNDASFQGTTPESQGNTSLAPDVYITNLTVSPNPPHQHQEITFTASFLNTNAQSVGMEWRVVFLNPAKTGHNKDWGQSQLTGITVPPGQSNFTLAYIPVTSNGPCVTLQALVARRVDDNGRVLLPGTGGGPFSTTYTFC